MPLLVTAAAQQSRAKPAVRAGCKKAASLLATVVITVLVGSARGHKLD